MQSFEYLKPKSLKEASELLGKDWKTSLPYAGGTDLYGMIKHDLETPETLVNLKVLPNLDSINYSSGKGLSIGALTKIADIAESQIVKERYTVLAQAAKKVGSPQLRNSGTLGGNLCQRPRCWYFRGEFDCLRKGGDICYAVDGENKYHCIIGGGPCFIVHPSDPAVALLALDAKVTISAGKKNRQIPLKDFFVLPEQNVMRENILKPGEIVTEIHIPDLPSGTVSGYTKFMERDVWDFAMVSVAVVLQKSGGRIKSGKVAYGGVAPIPWLEVNISKQLSGFNPSESNIDNISNQVLKDAMPLSQNEYKLPLARNLLKKQLTQLSMS